MKKYTLNEANKAICQKCGFLIRNLYGDDNIILKTSCGWEYLIGNIEDKNFLHRIYMEREMFDPQKWLEDFAEIYPLDTPDDIPEPQYWQSCVNEIAVALDKLTMALYLAA